MPSPSWVPKRDRRGETDSDFGAEGKKTGIERPSRSDTKRSLVALKRAALIDRKVLTEHGHPCGTHSIVFGVASVRRAGAATTLTRLLCTLRNVSPAGALHQLALCSLQLAVPS